MLGEWCLVVRPAETASVDQVRRLPLIFRDDELGASYRRQGADFVVPLPNDEALGTTEAAIMEALGRRKLDLAVVRPLPVGRWDPDVGRFLVAGVRPRRKLDPAVVEDEITWTVAVAPASAFDWRAARAALEERGRVTLRETDDAIEVGARDEVDAHALLAELATVAAVRDATAWRLSWLRRWQVRQQLLGNYAGAGDPTQPM